MFIFYGLGNNSQKYLQTKHNAGRIVLENFLKLEGLNLQEKPNFFYTKNLSNYFLISKGFMNNSADSLLALQQYFKIGFKNHNQTTPKIAAMNKTIILFFSATDINVFA